MLKLYSSWLLLGFVIIIIGNNFVLIQVWLFEKKYLAQPAPIISLIVYTKTNELVQSWHEWVRSYPAEWPNSSCEFTKWVRNLYLHMTDLCTKLRVKICRGRSGKASIRFDPFLNHFNLKFRLNRLLLQDYNFRIIFKRYYLCRPVTRVSSTAAFLRTWTNIHKRYGYKRFV